METPEKKQTPKGPYNQVVFTEYTKWREGQPFIKVEFIMPDGQTKVPAGSITLELSNDRKATYIAKDAEGKEIDRSHNMIELKKYFKDHGQELAMTHVEKQLEAKTPEVSAQEMQTANEPEEEYEHEEGKTEEMNSLRNKKEKTSGKNISR